MDGMFTIAVGIAVGTSVTASVVGAGALVGAGACVVTAVTVAAGPHEASRNAAMTMNGFSLKAFIITTFPL